MGCHTWFYNKLEKQPTYEEVRSAYLHRLESEIGYYERHISDKLTEEESFLFEDSTKQESEIAIAVLARLHRVVSNRLCKLATFTRYAETNLGEVMYFSTRTNLIYKTLANIHDVFRIYTYPKDELLSMKETLEFISKNEKNIFWGPSPNVLDKETVLKKLEAFWQTYPNGLIQFG